MDDLVLILRNGAPHAERGAPLALLQDSVSCVGGPAALRQIVRNLCSALQNRAITAYGLHTVGWSDLEHTCTRHIEEPDKVAWSHSTGQQKLQQGKPAQLKDTILRQAPWQADRPATADTLSSTVKWIVVITELSSLILCFGLAQVLACLHALTSHASVHSLLAYLHQDLHSHTTLFALERTAACTSTLASIGTSLSDTMPGSHIDGVLQTHCKRRTGRVQVKLEYYQLSADGGIRCIPAPAAAELQHGGVQQAVPQAKVTDAVHTVTGGMRLGLSLQEQEARQNVALPYEQGPILGALEGMQMEGKEDGALGQILYLRDSESEYDSDQDPDDDLDF